MNRDPAVFPNPHQFDVQRPEADQNVAFSSGIHYCIGVQLSSSTATGTSVHWTKQG